MSDYPEMHWDADAGQWVPPASQPAETQRHGDPGASGPGLALAQSGEDDDTGYDYHDTPPGNIWRPGDEPGQPSGDEPGRPDTGSYEVIHLGGQAAVVVPVTYFLRLRALELHASAEELQDAEGASAPARSPAAKRRPGNYRPGRGASLSFPDRPPLASPPRARTRMP
jgi:hypothetical protein